MKRIYSTPVCKTAAMTCDNILVESLHTGDSNTGGTGGGDFDWTTGQLGG